MSSLKDRYFTSFAFFEYRKIMRILGGEIFEKGTNPLVVGFLELSWLLALSPSFLLEGNAAQLCFTFYFFDQRNSPVLIWLVSFLAFQSLLLLIFAISWQFHHICEIFVVVTVIDVIVSFCVLYLTTNISVNAPIVDYTFTSIYACVVLHYLFNYYFAPYIIMWKYGHIVKYEGRAIDSTVFNNIEINPVSESTIGTQKSIYLKPIKIDSNLKKDFIQFPYYPTIKMLVFVFLMSNFIPIFVGFFILSLLGNLLGLYEWEFLSDKLFYRLEESYWVFEKLNDVRLPKNKSVMHNDYEQVAYYPKVPWYSMKRLLYGKGKFTFFEYCGDYEAVNNTPSSLEVFGKPHGYGEWKDSDDCGETCGGMFLHGTPIAPCLSREKLGQGTFRNQRIGFATVSGGDANEIEQGWPRFISEDNGHNGLCYGAAEVECCVSGTFYHNFPRTNYMLHTDPPKVSLSVSETWSCLMEPYIVDRSVHEFSQNLQCEINGMSEGHSGTLRATLTRSSSIKELLVKVEEVLIFIPGFNSSLRAGLNTYGQFWQLAGFPNTISPFLFCWPQVS